MATPLQSFPGFTYHQYGGIAQFTTIHILKSNDDYVIAHVISSDTSRVILPRLTADFVDEQRQLASLNSEHIIYAEAVHQLPETSLYWIGSTRFQSPPQTVESLIDQGIVLSADETAELGSHICQILAQLHERVSCHGALTPAAIILERGKIYISEVGLERLLRRSGLDTTSLPTALRQSYISPEQIAGAAPTVESDIYTLGVILYQLATGKLPFGGRTTTMVMASVLTDETAADIQTGGQEPGPVIQAILRSIEKEPADRWRSASRFAAALKDASLPISPAVTDLPITSPSPIRSGCLVTIAILSGLVGVGVLSRVF